jgi:PBSX family phage terminase large subunit
LEFWNSDVPAQPADVAYQPFGAAKELFHSSAAEVLLAGPAGTGKSRACLEKLNFIAMHMPIRGAIVRKVRKTVTQAAQVTFEEKVLGRYKTAVHFHTGDQEYRYPQGARIIVAGLDDPEKIGSTEFDLIYVQEATELDEDDWGMLLRGLRNGVLPYQQLLADCNPAWPEHWLKLRCNSGTTSLLDSRHEDNPTLYDAVLRQWTPFGREYIARLDSLKDYQYQRLRLGNWVAAEGQYFTEWTPDVHVVEPFEIPAEWPRWIAVDYGFAAPFCCLWFARCPEDRQIYVYREAYLAGLRDEQQAELIVARSEGEQLALRVLDPSMFNSRTEQQRPSIATVYWQHGCWPVFPGMNSRKQGWAITRRAMAHDAGPPRLRVLRDRAPNLCREIPAAVRDPLDPEDVADTLNGTKTSDHAIDALRYGLCAEAQPPQETATSRLVFK